MLAWHFLLAANVVTPPLMNTSYFSAPQEPWREATAASTFGDLQAHWLLRPGALTAGLRALGQLELFVLREHKDILSASEAWMIRQQPGSAIWVREIYMSINNTACVTARSITPLSAAQNSWQGIRGLGTRPLADLLYHDTEIRRDPFWVGILNPEQPLYQAVQRTQQHHPNAVPINPPLLARSSTFWYQNAPLLVAECFLPSFWPLARSIPLCNT